MFHVPLAALRRVCFHTDLPCRPQPPAPPTARTFPCLNLPELARTFMPDLLLSLPPQQSNLVFQTLQLSELAELVGTCRNLCNFPELAGTCGTCRTCRTCRNLRNLPELAGTCRNLRNLSEIAGTLSSQSERLGCDHFCFTFPWPPCVAFASTLTYHVGHSLQHPPQPGPFLA